MQYPSSSWPLLWGLAFLHLATAKPPPISIVPVPSYIPTIVIDPLAESTGAYTPPALTIVPQPDMLGATSMVEVVLPPVSTVVGTGEESTTMVVEEGFTSTSNVPGGLFPFCFPTYIILL